MTCTPDRTAVFFRFSEVISALISHLCGRLLQAIRTRFSQISLQSRVLSRKFMTNNAGTPYRKNSLPKVLGTCSKLSSTDCAYVPNAFVKRTRNYCRCQLLPNRIVWNRLCCERRTPLYGTPITVSCNGKRDDEAVRLDVTRIKRHVTGRIPELCISERPPSR